MDLTKRVGVNLTAEELAEVDRIAAEDSRTRTNTVRLAVRELIARREGENK